MFILLETTSKRNRHLIVCNEYLIWRDRKTELLNSRNKEITAKKTNKMEKNWKSWKKKTNTSPAKQPLLKIKLE